jgi:integrase
MKGQSFVLDTVRTLFAWAADPERGNLLPDGFRNPFLRHGEASAVLKGDPLSEPDITISMALDLLAASDRLQLLLFAPMILFGLRAAEPCFLFHEYIQNGWLSVPSNTDLAYRTKGRRDKRLPLIDSLQPLWHVLHASGQAGVLYLRRRVVEGVEVAPLRDHSLPKLVAEFEHRCARVTVISGAERHKVRNAVMREAGAMTYDDVEQEFRRLSSKLCWPASATLKDLRHLFATSMSNAGMPEAYRRYLMGHSPGKSAIIAYTHLNQLAEHYANAVGRELAPLVEAVRKRVAELS